MLNITQFSMQKDEDIITALTFGLIKYLLLHTENFLCFADYI